MKMHVLDLGKLAIDENSMAAGTNVPTRSAPHRPNARIDIPVSSYCIEHADGNVLFDLGCHPDAMGPEGRWSSFSISVPATRTACWRFTCSCAGRPASS